MPPSSIITTPLSILLLSAWTGTALIFTALNAVIASTTALETIGSTSLFTYLLCRLYVAFTSRESTSLPRTLTNAYTHSRTAAITLLVFAAAWLHQLYQRVLMLMVVTFFTIGLSIIMHLDKVASAAGGKLVVADGAGPVPMPMRMSGTEAFKKEFGFEELETELEVDFANVFESMPTGLLLWGGLMLWVGFLSLGVYLLWVGYRAVKGVFGEYDAPAPTIMAPAVELRPVRAADAADSIGVRGGKPGNPGPGLQTAQGAEGAYSAQRLPALYEAQGGQAFDAPRNHNVAASQAAAPIRNDAGPGFWISWG
ncbi:uncharacterized protein DSM5745_00335 [Aspergillus mulundensis]|uniref:Uncharacterized protein n=1 Tax=Aspergillus mulundensis TaxID=1810919 RepID=A0A3D8T385_9EURO|nr:hypothetical protein DSM5745_00335 [Aspergillus mulundensis]RDW93013.1 hypothetical protein DSM5745_00335 [Aspergillus mulundensis]